MGNDVNGKEIRRLSPPFLSQITCVFWVRNAIYCMIGRYTRKKSMADRRGISFEVVKGWFNDLPKIVSESVHCRRPQITDGRRSPHRLARLRRKRINVPVLETFQRGQAT